MADDRGNPVDLVTAAPPEPRGEPTDFRELRSLLVGPEQRRLAELTRRVDEFEVTAAEVADLLPEAIALRAGRDRQLVRALAPTVESALRESVRRNPRDIATAIFPVLGPAIRKAIAEAMAGLVRSINTAVDQSFSIRGIRWRIESWRSGVPFAEIVLRHALLYRVEQVFLIHADTGLLLAHVAGAGLKVDSADLISGMLTAIQDFTRDSFRPGEGGTLRRFSVGDHTVLVEPGPQALIAAVVRGEPPNGLVARLQDVLETIHLQMAPALAGFAGESAPFEVAKPMLASCLETVLTTDQTGAGSGRAWLRWAVPAALIVGSLAGWWLWTGRRWSAAIDRLEAEPGITIVRADRGIWRSRISGLKDPLAADPAPVLAAGGIDPGSIVASWAPYLSLDSAMIVDRARQSLGLPRSVSLALRGDTLVASGEGPIDQLAGLTRAGAVAAGVRRVDWSGLVPSLPIGLASRARAIDEARILFPIGGSALGGSAFGVIDSVAASTRAIDAAVQAAGFAIDLVVQGRADPSGSDGLNQELSRLRTDAVVARLVGLGVSPQSIRATALGTGDPLDLPGADRAQVNRSVSFAIRIRGNGVGKDQ